MESPQDQQFILRWHFQESTLLSGLPKLLDSELLTDITLSVGCKKIKAHKIILATCSQYFLQLFQCFKDMDSLQHPVIILQDTDYNDLNAIISFIYRGQCLVTEKQLPSIINTAKLLQIRGLCDFKVPDNNQKDLEIINNSTNSLEPYVVKDEIINNNNNEQQTTTICDTQTNLNNVQPSENFPSILTNSNNNNIEVVGPPSTRAVCPICSKALSNQYNLRVHLETHRGARHACPTCSHVSRSRDALRKHVAYRHPPTGHVVHSPHSRRRRGDV